MDVKSQTLTGWIKTNRIVQLEVKHRDTEITKIDAVYCSIYNMEWGNNATFACGNDVMKPDCSRQRVVVDGKYSAWSSVTNGVSQGSVLSPKLFVIFINEFVDLFHHIQHSSL